MSSREQLNENVNQKVLIYTSFEIDKCNTLRNCEARAYNSGAHLKFLEKKINLQN